MSEVRHAVPVAPRRRITVVAAMAAIVVLASACINDGAWSPLPAPVTPVQGLSTQLNDVSCVAEDWCLAVGSMGDLPLAQTWDGSRWSVVPAPSLEGASDMAMLAVACATATSCVAEVTQTYPSTGDVYDDAVGWDGSRWHPLDAGTEGGTLESIPLACAPDGSCLVFQNGWDRTKTWDGSTVTTFTGTAPSEDVNAIHCFSATECLAAGTSSMFSWNGSTWSSVAGSDYWEIFYEGPLSFDCFAPDDCIATGQHLYEPRATSVVWNGSTWTEVPLPAGTTYASWLECVEGDGCLLRASGSTGLLAWMAGGWYSAPSPIASSGVSCLPGWCLGVSAAGSPLRPTAATYEWTNP